MVIKVVCIIAVENIKTLKMENKIAIIGSGVASAIIENLKKIDDTLIVIDEQKAKDLSYLHINPFIITNPYPMEIISGEKQFLCKGKHQYRKVVNESKVEWVCQCGRRTCD